MKSRSWLSRLVITGIVNPVIHFVINTCNSQDHRNRKSARPVITIDPTLFYCSWWAVLSARITGSANLAVMKSESRNTFGLADNSLTGTQKALLDKALEIVRDHMSDPDFSNEVFIKEMAMCKTVLYEKLRTITGQTISEFITCLRLRQAKHLLLHRSSSISAIAYDTGFKSPSLFSWNAPS